MTLTTLDEMIKIEQEAKEVKESYRSKLELLQTKLNDQLHKELETYDLETTELLKQAKQHTNEKIMQAQKQAEESLALNEQQIRSALEHEKERLIDEIVQKVVEVYGN